MLLEQLNLIEEKKKIPNWKPITPEQLKDTLLTIEGYWGTLRKFKTQVLNSIKEGDEGDDILKRILNVNLINEESLLSIEFLDVIMGIFQLHNIKNS